MSQAVFGGNALGLAAFGLFSGHPKIDDLGHQETRGNRIRWRGPFGPVSADNEYGGNLTLDHDGCEFYAGARRVVEQNCRDRPRNQ